MTPTHRQEYFCLWVGVIFLYIKTYTKLDFTLYVGGISMKPTIETFIAREIFDSRGNPTVEVDCILSNGVIGRATVPSGASTGEKEAVELRDRDIKRLNGNGVLNALKNVQHVIAPKLRGMTPTRQREIDELMIELDGTTNKSKLGANAMLGVSMAVSRAASEQVPLYRYIGGMDIGVPLPFFNVINGGRHADSGIDIQEFMITPIGAPTFRLGMESIVNVYHKLKELLSKEGYVTSVGDEGGFAPRLSSSEEAIEFLIRAMNDAGYQSGKDIAIALDPAASEFYREGKYHFEGKTLSSVEMVSYYEQLVQKYPIISIEDGLSENDWDSWNELTTKLGYTIQIVGDDIFVTNSSIFKQGIEKNIGNAILIKLNQIGTVTETIQTIQIARKAGYQTMISHRSGETEDTFISDFAVGMMVGQIKTGAVARTERVSKYNQFLRIEEELGLNHFQHPFQNK